MLKAYDQGRFKGGTGPNSKDLEAQKLERKTSISSQRIISKDDAANIDFSQQQQQNH